MNNDFDTIGKYLSSVSFMLYVISFSIAFLACLAVFSERNEIAARLISGGVLFSIAGMIASKYEVKEE